jgi:hypothetical protein
MSACFDRQSSFIGKRLLVGITYLNREGKLLGHEQFHGRIVEVGQCGIVILRAETGARASLPPAVESAVPGNYRLRSTGEVIIDPDFVAEWTFVEERAV